MRDRGKEVKGEGRVSEEGDEKEGVRGEVGRVSRGRGRLSERGKGGEGEIEGRRGIESRRRKSEIEGKRKRE